MTRAILFDIDGVLLDSLRANAKFFRDLLAHFGHVGPTDDELRPIFHFSMRDAIHHLVPDAADVEIESMAKYGDQMESNFDLLEMPSEAPAVIAELSKKYKLGVVTGRTRAGVEEFFEFSKLKQYFQAIAAYEDTAQHKPNPAPLLYACQQLRVTSPEAVFIGDATTDIQAANAAGMPMILYADRSQPGTTITVGKFSDIPVAVQNIASTVTY